MSTPSLRVVLGMKGEAVTDAVDAYLLACRARGLRVATIEMYAWALRGATIREWIQARTLADLDQTAMDGMLVFLRDKGLGPHTVDDYRRVWRSFLRWAQETGRIDAAPTLKRGPLPESERRHLSADEEDRLLAACICERDRVLLRFMIGTGLRLGEVVAANCEDLEEIGGQWVIRVGEETAKGRRHRRVPLDTPGRSLSRELAAYIRDHRPGPPRGPLWLTSRRGAAGEYERLSRGAVSSMFQRLRKATGVPVHPHICRHTFATRALAAGIPERSLRTAGGWRNAASLDPYIHAQTEQLLRDWGGWRKE